MFGIYTGGGTRRRDAMYAREGLKPTTYWPNNHLDFNVHISVVILNEGGGITNEWLDRR